MARAAVKAKQAQAAQAQAAVSKPARKQRGHASGGNPNQDLFFSRLRRRQKWVFVGLAVVFAVSFAALGVGSGNGVDLGALFNSLSGSGSDPVAQAQADIKDGKVTAYKDLANAYVAKNDLPQAISTLETYLTKRKKDSAGWAQLGGLEKRQGDKYAQEYQQVQQSTKLESPGTIFQLTGKDAPNFGTNKIDEYYTQKNNALLTPLYQNATQAYSHSLTAFQDAAKYAKGTLERAAAEQAVATAAQNAGQTQVALEAWQRYVNLVPDSPNLAQIEALCKHLTTADGKPGSCVPTKHKKK